MMPPTMPCSRCGPWWILLRPNTPPRQSPTWRTNVGRVQPQAGLALPALFRSCLRVSGVVGRVPHCADTIGAKPAALRNLDATNAHMVHGCRLASGDGALYSNCGRPGDVRRSHPSGLPPRRPGGEMRGWPPLVAASRCTNSPGRHLHVRCAMSRDKASAHWSRGDQHATSPALHQPRRGQTPAIAELASCR
jgi:hypothetical protein